MQINIQAPFEVNEHLKEMISTKIEKLATFYSRIQKAEVFLKLKEDQTPNGKTVEVNLHLPLKKAFAKDTSNTFEKAIAGVANKLEIQLKKHKEKSTKKH